MAGRSLTLVLGGAASGKSAYAEGEVMSAAAGRRAVYVATAEPLDGEMALKIDAHRARRGDGWTTVEAPLDLAAAVSQSDSPGGIILVDCLTLWLSNLLAAGRDVPAETERLVAVLAARRGAAVLVSNEVGLGIVPDNRLARMFREAQGTLNRRIAGAADRVVFIAAGLPLVLKGGDA